jgi:undecaprenyl-diphosphatase
MRGGLPRFDLRRLDPRERYGLRVTLLAAALALVAVPFSTLVFQVAGEGSLTELDARLADGMNDAVHGAPGAVGPLQVVSWLGRAVWLAAVVAVGASVLWRRGRRRLAAFLVVTAVGGGLLNTAVKIAVDRPRPVVDHPVSTAFGKSFPSGHSMASTVCYGALLTSFLPWVPRRARTPVVGATVLLVVAIGCSRLLVGVHFLSDVVGGFLLGAAWLAGAVAVFQVWRAEEAVARRDRRPGSLTNLG